MEKCMRCGHDIIIGGNDMISDIYGEELSDDEDAMVTNAQCPHCGAKYVITDVSEYEKQFYPYWK